MAQNSIGLSADAALAEYPGLLAELQQSYQGKYVFVWTHSVDGCLQQLQGGAFEPLQHSGNHFVFGKVVDIGRQDWGSVQEPYLVIDSAGKPLCKVLYPGVQQIYIGDIDQLLHFVGLFLGDRVIEAFTGDEEMENRLKAAGFQHS